MIEDMTVRGFTEETHSNYIREVRAFAAFIRRPPDTATAEDLRRFQLHQTQSGMQPPSINSSVSALRYLFHRDTRPAGACPAAHGRAPAASATGGAERGGDYASAPGGAATTPSRSSSAPATIRCWNRARVTASTRRGSCWRGTSTWPASLPRRRPGRGRDRPAPPPIRATPSRPRRAPRGSRPRRACAR